MICIEAEDFGDLQGGHAAEGDVIFAVSKSPCWIDHSNYAA